MDPIAWLAICFSLPSEPSRPRVAAWRALKRLGAVNIPQSMWVLPTSDDNEAALARLSDEIEAAGGESFLVRNLAFRPRDEARIVARADQRYRLAQKAATQ
jgi:hypothetical protein